MNIENVLKVKHELEEKLKEPMGIMQHAEIGCMIRVMEMFLDTGIKSDNGNDVKLNDVVTFTFKGDHVIRFGTLRHGVYKIGHNRHHGFYIKGDIANTYPVPECLILEVMKP